jgi:hypothetical protein
MLKCAVVLATLLAMVSGPALARHRALPSPIPAVPPVTVTYDVYVGGVHLMTADVTFEEKASRYRARVLGRTAGLWYRLFPWDTELKVEGRIRGDRFVPSEFYTRDVWGHKPRVTWLHFLKNGDVKPAFDPPNTDKNRGEITLRQRRGSLDPVTGLLQLLAHVAVYNSCDVTVPIFEGKRRFDIAGVDVGREAVDDGDYSAFKGVARTCDADFTMVAGEWKDRPPDRFWTRDGHDNSREPFHIWLGSPAEGLPEMAVRLESGSVWGLIVMHLSSWHYATPDEMKF